MFTEKFRSVYLPEYDEGIALCNLIYNIDAAADYQNNAMEHGDDNTYEEVVIIVNGVSHAFLLGGPQIEGLFRFINNVADENGHELPGGEE